jgi:hypothetical protein
MLNKPNCRGEFDCGERTSGPVACDRRTSAALEKFAARDVVKNRRASRTLKHFVTNDVVKALA